MNFMFFFLYIKEDVFKVFCGIDFYFFLIVFCKICGKEGDIIESR